LGPRPTSVDIVSPGGQTISVSVEGVPPSTIPDVVCPPAKGVTDPAVSVPDASQLPLTKPDYAASAGVKRALGAPLFRRLVLPSPEILFVWT
jgi:hypothetical protein